MKFVLKIESDNEAMVDHAESATADMLREVASKLEDGYDGGKLRDVNGNSVGSWKLTTR